MTFLDHITPEQRNMIVSLPYRAGLWVGRSDTSGGTEAEQQELQALSNIIHAFAEDMFGSEEMQHIISETITKKARWPEWAGEVESVPEDCRQAVDVINEHAGSKDVTVFRNHLIDIGEAVALAFQEHRGFRFGAYLTYLFAKFRKKPWVQRVQSFEGYLRISVPERKALAALANALGAAY